MAYGIATRLRLLRVDLDSDYLHTIYFSKRLDQEKYFQHKLLNNNTKYEFISDFTYLRKDQIINVPFNFEEIKNVNYLMYTYDDTNSPKYYYCFVKDIKYINEETTALHIETDVIQTYMFDITIHHSFVEREHVSDDTIGLHTVPESLETGDFVASSTLGVQNIFPFNRANCVSVLAVTELLNGIPYTASEEYVPCGVYYIAFTTVKGLKAMVEAYQSGKADAISHIFIAPKEFFTTWKNVELNTGAIDGQVSTTLSFRMTKGVEIAAYNVLGNNYAPRNNKLLTAPYRFLQVSNNTGSVANYNYEDFGKISGDGKIRFGLAGVLSPGCSMVLTPQDYKLIGENYDESIALAKFPIGSWNSDVYTNWLTQNSVNIGISATTSIASIVGGTALMLTGAGAIAGGGMIAGGVMGIANQIGQHHERSMIPDQAGGNLNNSDVNYHWSRINFTVKQMVIKEEYAKIIDGFFDMFGYKVNAIKVPNKNHRKAYWYTKTIDVVITGAVPQADLQKIKDCYNKGITFWRPDYFKDYDIVNNII